MKELGMIHANVYTTLNMKSVYEEARNPYHTIYTSYEALYIVAATYIVIVIITEVASF
jgi:hypothetical protein